MLRKISTWFEQDENIKQEHDFKKCDHMDCTAKGLYKAPKNSKAISNHHDRSQWYWFCKEHVREYNAKWNFYKDMNQDQAYKSFKSDLVWNRPTRSFSSNAYQQFHSVEDPFSIFSDNAKKTSIYLNNQENEALHHFSLHYPFTAEELQSSYRNLVKAHHPDLHKTKDSEEEIRKINQSYQILKKLVRS